MKEFVATAFLSPLNHGKPTLEIHREEIRTDYDSITVRGYDHYDTIVAPDGFDEEGRPYFSDEFYQRRLEEYKKVVRYDKEKARKLFWFTVHYQYK